MAEAEVDAQQPAVDVEVENGVPAVGSTQAPAADPADRMKYDDSLLIRVKGKVKKPTAPDQQERNLQTEKLQQEIEKHRNRMAEIKAIEEARRNARSSNAPENAEINRKIQVLRKDFGTVLSQKQHLRSQAMEASRARGDLRGELRKLKERLPRGMSPETLEAKIAELEHKLAHDPGSAENEKAIFKRMQECTAARPAVREYLELESRLKRLDEEVNVLQPRINECDAILNDNKAQQEDLQRVADGNKARGAEVDADLPALQVEKKECWEIINLLRDKVTEIRNDFNAKYQEYIKLDRNHRGYMNHVKHQEWLERQKQREERAAAEQEADPDAPASATASTTAGSERTPAPEAYASEVFTIDQMVIYLRKLMPSDEKSGASDAGKKVAEVEVPQGMKAMKKKDDIPDFFTVSKKKPQQGKGGAAAATAAAAQAASSSKGPAAAEPSKKRLQHTLEMLQTFMSLEVAVPQTVGELSDTLKKLEEKKAHFLELRRNPPPPKVKAPKPVPAPSEPEPPAELLPAAAPAEEETSTPAPAETTEAPIEPEIPASEAPAVAEVAEVAPAEAAEQVVEVSALPAAEQTEESSGEAVTSNGDHAAPGGGEGQEVEGGATGEGEAGEGAESMAEATAEEEPAGVKSSGKEAEGVAAEMSVDQDSELITLKLSVNGEGATV